MSTKKGRALQTFSDAGTGETFAGGKDHTFEAGAFANYEVSGLVRASSVERPTKAPAKRGATSARKPAPSAPSSAPASAPAPSPEVVAQDA